MPQLFGLAGGQNPYRGAFDWDLALLDADCGDCHLSGQLDWAALGWTGDPAIDPVRP